MEQSFTSRLKHAWNAFFDKSEMYSYHGPGYSYRPDRARLTRGNDRSIITSVYNRIALDVSAISIKHVRLDDKDRFSSVIDSGLNRCLNLEANVDQTGRAFIQDIVLSMFDEGCVAVVPVETSVNPMTGAFEIYNMRVGRILEWYSDSVKVRIYNEWTGQKEEIIQKKTSIAIIENPFYAVMNEPNSTVQRLIHKLALMDSVDDQANSGKLNMIIQLPYIIKTEAKRQQAEKRRRDIEEQLATSEYGIAYTDGTEKIVQLNRALDNNLLSQVQYLTSQLFAYLGLTQTILDGSADEQTMLNYNTKTIEPIVSAIVNEFKRKFLSKTARAQKQSISFFSDPFRLVPVSNIAEIADKFTRNEIMSSNEFRQIVGLMPSTQPGADELRNKNLNQASDKNETVVEVEEDDGASKAKEFIEKIKKERN